MRKLDFFFCSCKSDNLAWDLLSADIILSSLCKYLDQTNISNAYGEP